MHRAPYYCREKSAVIVAYDHSAHSRTIRVSISYIVCSVVQKVVGSILMLQNVTNLQDLLLSFLSALERTGHAKYFGKIYQIPLIDFYIRLCVQF